jgi:hypothetical protein
VRDRPTRRDARPIDLERGASPVATAGIPSFDAQPRGSLEGGTYALEAFPPLRIVFTVPEGWSKLLVPTAIWGYELEDNLIFLRVDNVFRDPCAPNLGLHDPPIGGSVADLVAALGRVSGLKPLAPVATTVSGFPATRIDLDASGPWEGCAGETKLLHVKGLFDTPVPDPSHHHELSIIDANGHRLVIGLRTVADASEAHLAELRDLVDAVRIESD